MLQTPYPVSCCNAICQFVKYQPCTHTCYSGHEAPKERRANMDELDDLSRRITTCWASLGRKLGVNEDILDGITVNNFQYPSPEEKALKMLKGWRKKGKASSIVELAAALRKVGKGGLAEQFE